MNDYACFNCTHANVIGIISMYMYARMLVMINYNTNDICSYTKGHHDFKAAYICIYTQKMYTYLLRFSCILGWYMDHEILLNTPIHITLCTE